MALYASTDEITTLITDTSSLSTFPTYSKLETEEQQRRFELLRLAFFSLKLRKVKQRFEEGQEKLTASPEQRKEHEFRCSLLRHAIFQEVLALISLDARAQALSIIEACQK